MLDLLTILLLGVILWKLFQDIVPSRKPTNRIILDSCALIDGRVVELAKSGFLSETLVVPEFVLHELQMLADSSDAHKRERARYGLDVVQELKGLETPSVVVEKVLLPDIKKVDDKLVALATSMKATLYTTDYNLAKIATIADVKVLNVNELAGALRPVVLPGEERIIKVIQKGSGNNQGLGYMPDGTMLVVENGAGYVGKSVKVSVTRMLQTQAGKMVFAHVVPSPKVSTRQDARVTARLIVGRKTSQPARTPKQI